MDIEDRIREIKTAVQNAERMKARAEVQRDQAKASVKESVERLRSDFGVSSIQEARDLRDRLQNKLNLRLEEIQEVLDSFSRG